MTHPAEELSEDPCPRCLPLAGFGRIRAETVQRLPANGPPLDMQGNPCCWDCQAADNLVKMKLVPTPIDENDSIPFIMARVVVGNDRQEQYRLPGVLIGLVKEGLVRPSKKGDLQKHWDWMERNDWFNLRGIDGDWP